MCVSPSLYILCTQLHNFCTTPMNNWHENRSQHNAGQARIWVNHNNSTLVCIQHYKKKFHAFLHITPEEMTQIFQTPIESKQFMNFTIGIVHFVDSTQLHEYGMSLHTNYLRRKSIHKLHKLHVHSSRTRN